jgi:biopolymer transport protein ExbB
MSANHNNATKSESMRTMLNRHTDPRTKPVMASGISQCVARLATGAGRLVALAVPLWLGLSGLALAQEGAPTTPVAGNADLPRDLSPWGMFMTADPVVKAVLIGLLFASLVTWTVWLAKTIELTIARRRARAALKTLGSVRFLTEAAQRVGEGTAGQFVDAAVAELRLSDDGMEREGIKERVASRLERIEANKGRHMMRGTGVLATIGATAPFVGLFGTVWGIMNSFIGISKSQTTNLAVVAPGIAEALLATAFGLVAAIPAVVIYNVFSRQIAAYRAQLADTSAEVLRLVGRDLDRSAATPPSSVRRSHLSAAE